MVLAHSSDERKRVAKALVDSIAAADPTTQRVEFQALISHLSQTSAVHELHVAWDHAQQLGQTDPTGWHNPEDTKLIRVMFNAIMNMYKSSGRLKFSCFNYKALCPHLTEEERTRLDNILSGYQDT